MKLQTIFDQLTYGELSQVAIGGGEEGAITAASYPKIIAHINLGLTALYKRFPLKQGKVTLQLQNGVTRYNINSEYATSNRRSRQAVKYLLDTVADPFVDDIYKIEQVTDDDGKDLVLNDRRDAYAVMTPSVTVLDVPVSLVNGAADNTENLVLVYRAGHIPLVITQGLFDPTRIEVALPDTHLEPLLYFVASRVYNPVGMGQEFNAGNTWYAKYEAACRDLETQNLRVDQGSDRGDRFVAKGFV